jgi:hypothetical protein
MANKGFDFAVKDAPPPDKMGDDAEAPDEADDDGGLVSAVHDLAKAFGVTVKDEPRAVAAVRDICRLGGMGSDGYDDEE